MSVSAPARELIERAAAVERAATHEMTQRTKASPREAAENRVSYRAAMRNYLSELKAFLRIMGVAREAIEPLETLTEQLAAIDDFGSAPSLFSAGGMPFGFTKPMARLAAEGHAAGCAAYIHGDHGVGLLRACDMVAALFSRLGHAGRISERLHGDAKPTSSLSSKTVYYWCNELALMPGPDLGARIRYASRHEAIMELIRMQDRDPIGPLSEKDALEKLKVRIASIAAISRIGAPDGPKVTRKISGTPM